MENIKDRAFKYGGDGRELTVIGGWDDLRGEQRRVPGESASNTWLDVEQVDAKPGLPGERQGSRGQPRRCRRNGDGRIRGGMCDRAC